jgi:prevent-host-death family protein
MNRIPLRISVTEFGRKANSIIDGASSSRQPVFILQRGRVSAVLVSLEAYDEAQREREILYLLAKGEKEIRVGEGHELSAVLGEADDLQK